MKNRNYWSPLSKSSLASPRNQYLMSKSQSMQSLSMSHLSSPRKNSAYPNRSLGSASSKFQSWHLIVMSERTVHLSLRPPACLTIIIHIFGRLLIGPLNNDLNATFNNYLSRKRESSRSKVYTKIKHLWITNVTYFIGRKTRRWIIKNTKHFKSLLRIERDIPFFKNVKIKVNHEFIKGQISKKLHLRHLELFSVLDDRPLLHVFLCRSLTYSERQSSFVLSLTQWPFTCFLLRIKFIFRSNYLIQTGTLLNEVRNDRQEKIEQLKIGIVEVKVSDQK